MVSLEGISPLAVVETFRQLSGTACFLVSQVQARTRTRTHTHPKRANRTHTRYENCFAWCGTTTWTSGMYLSLRGFVCIDADLTLGAILYKLSLMHEFFILVVCFCGLEKSRRAEKELQLTDMRP